MPDIHLNKNECGEVSRYAPLYLKSATSSESSPRCSSCGSSSDPDDRSTTRRLLFGGALPAPLSLLGPAAYLGSWRCLERLSRSSSSVSVCSPPLSDPRRRGGDRILFAVDPLLLGILSRGWRQGTNSSPRTCKIQKPTMPRSHYI